MKRIKDASKAVYEEGKLLPKPVFVAMLILPFGLEVMAVYLVARAVLKKVKK
jgi:hypothetical protein